MRLANYREFVMENSKPVRQTAGVAIVFENKLLVVHPTNSGWKKGTCGIPKGGMDPGEDPMEAAIRELWEETGISIRPEQLDRSPEVVTFYSSGGVVRGQLTYYVARIKSLSEIGLDSLKVPKQNLQLDEIDWAKFVGPKEAYPIMSRGQLIILDRLLDIRADK